MPTSLLRQVALKIIMCPNFCDLVALNLGLILLKTLSALFRLYVLLFKQNKGHCDLSFLCVVKAVPYKVKKNLKVPTFVSIDVREILFYVLTSCLRVYNL